VSADRRRALGTLGEAAAEQWYEARGYVVADRNWRCSDGEIDLVVRSPEATVVICEVKTRSSTAFGTPFDAVTAAKQRRLRRLAACWLASRAAGTGYAQVRFDVAAVTLGPRGALAVEVIEGAF